MKYFPIFLILLSIASCKKKSEATVYPLYPDDYRSKFVDTLTNNNTNNYPLFTGNAGPGNYFYIVQKQNGSDYNLYRCDYNINSVTQQTINLGNDALMKIAGSKISDHFFTLTSSNNSSSPAGAPINAYVQAFFYSDSSKPCDSHLLSDYMFTDTFTLGTPISVQNKSEIRCYSSNGTILWNYILNGNYYSGNSMETDLLGNTYVLTASKSPAHSKLSTQFTNTLIPYYDMILDSNSFTLYKFDKNGNQLFNKTINNVNEEVPGTFEPNLTLTKKNIFVNNAKNLFTFDLDGNLLKSNKPLVNKCYNYIISVVGNAHQYFGLLDGFLNYSISSKNNYMVNLQGFSQLTIYENGKLKNLSIMDEFANCFAFSGSSLSKVDRYGNLIYNKILFFPPYNFYVYRNSVVVDRFNDLYIFDKTPNQIRVFKIDVNGNFQ